MILKQILKSILILLDFFAKNKIIHSDIKT